MRAAGKGERYYENLRTYWGLKVLLSDFIVHNYTLKVIGDPDKFDARGFVPPRQSPRSYPPFSVGA